MNFKIAKNESEAWDLQDMQTGKPHGWIQFKGTELCMDIHCKCGHLGHIDGDFIHVVICPNCNTQYMLNGHIEFIEIKEPSDRAKMGTL